MILILPTALENGDRLPEAVQANKILHRILDYAHNIFAELNEDRARISKQQVSRTVILDKYGWVNGLAHGKTNTLRLLHGNKISSFGYTRNGPTGVSATATPIALSPLFILPQR